MPTGSPQQIRPAAAGEVIDLRHAVLRAGLPRDTAVFAGDDDPAARHFVAILDDRIVGCVTLHPSQWEGRPAWQLRGMAVEPGLQGSGVGRALLEAVEESVRGDSAESDSPMAMLWCNARVPAIGFYRRHGWDVVSQPFVVPTAGPHVKMIKRPGPGVR
jgi:GNAT superfamily N-acetyltransferase